MKRGKIELPNEFNYVEAYLTLKCNYDCSYCINEGMREEHKLNRKRAEMRSEDWANSLNRIDFKDVPLTLGGGEPTIYDGFYDLLDNLDKKIKIDLLTNLEFDMSKFLKRVNPERFNKNNNPAYRSIRVSFHPEREIKKRGYMKGLIERARYLQENKFSIGIFGISHPKNLEANMEMAELSRQNQVYFFVKDFLGDYGEKLFGHFAYPLALDGKEKKAKCRIKELLIGPNGNVYKCHRDLYKEELEIGNIKYPSFQIEYLFRSCGKYGKCNLCDVKLKTNRFLESGNCQVEIISED